MVLFCGAGISYPAGLPGFDGLVQRLFDDLGESPNAVQQAAIKARQFDTAIGLLEDRIVGGRETVRDRVLIASAIGPGPVRPPGTERLDDAEPGGQTRLAHSELAMTASATCSTVRPSVSIRRPIAARSSASAFITAWSATRSR